MAEIFLGTSGYDYPEWKGVFYPDELKRKDFLLYYSTVFNALELNFSFYGMPGPEQMRSFYERSEGRLSFSVKANRALTHETGCAWKDCAREFQGAVLPLLEKDALCSVLFQFPQSFHYTKENRIYLADLLAEFRDFPCVVEFRHREWVRESVFAGLDERGAGVVFCDMPRLHNLPAGDSATPFVGKTAYIRLHGRNEEAWYNSGTGGVSGGKNGSARYRYDYSEEELASFVPVIRRAAGEGRKTAVFFNNHPDGSGALNARRLGEMLVAKEYKLVL